jgi:hypothetical protein
MYRRVPYWQAAAVLSAAAFVAGLFINPPYGFAPEDNLEYARQIRMQQAGIAQLAQRDPGATVLTAWPMTDELTRPELGYVTERWDVCPINDFSPGQVAQAAEEPEKYSAALVFSTKYEPASPVFTLGKASRALDERYFGLHYDLEPEAIALELGGNLVWESRNHGMWIALIRFNRPVEAQAEQGVEAQAEPEVEAQAEPEVEAQAEHGVEAQAEQEVEAQAGKGALRRGTALQAAE